METTVILYTVLLICSLQGIIGGQNLTNTIQCIQDVDGIHNKVSCYAECSDCICTLDNASLTSNCTNRYFVKQVIYPFDNITQLYLSSLHVHIITKAAFTRFGKSLLGLDLEGSGLYEIQLGAFDGLIRLEWLDLSNNALHKIKVGTFKGLISLEMLYLEHNVLKEIQVGIFEVGVFDRLMCLKQLQLAANDLHIHSIQLGVFKHLTSLWYLIMRDNALKQVHPAMFREVTNLSWLD